MAKKKLKSFFRLQRRESDAIASSDDESTVVAMLLDKPNPGVAKAKKKGFPITVAEGNCIYEITADDVRKQIGTVQKPDKEIEIRTYKIR